MRSGVVTLAVLAVCLLTVCATAFAQPVAGTAATPAAGPADDAATLQKLAQTATPSTVAIAVAGDFVYVVDGGVLYQFSVNGLQLVSKAQLAPKTKKAKRKKGNLPPPDAGLPNPAVGPPAVGAPATGAPATGAPAGDAQPADNAPPAPAK